MAFVVRSTLLSSFRFGMNQTLVQKNHSSSADMLKMIYDSFLIDSIIN